MSDEYSTIYYILTSFIPQYLVPIILGMFLVGLMTRFIKNL